jgi:hypothetical protein
LLLYCVLVVLVGSSGWAWFVIPNRWWRDSTAGEPLQPTNTLSRWRRHLLFAGLIAISLSMLDHLSLATYGHVLHNRFNHFSSSYIFIVQVNILTCYFAMAASVLGKGFARLPLFVASALLCSFGEFRWQSKRFVRPLI